MPKPEFLKVPPLEAVAHFRAKGFHVGFDWRDTAAGEHLRSFTVAKAMKLDILEDIRGATDAALAEGLSFRQFQERLEPILRSKGWWGRGKLLDPKTGKMREVQLGSPRRLRIIYDTNLRMSHAKGRWERIERLAAERPFLRYVAVLDGRTRPEHMEWHGTVLPWDHPFWSTHYPPNGWRCRCLVQQFSAEELADFGYEPSGGPPPGSGETRAWTNKRTGQTVQVPRGIDPGFGHNVGKVAQIQPAQKLLAEKIAAAPPPLAAAAKLEKLDDWVVAGRQERARLVEAAGGNPDAAGFSARFKAALTGALRERRGAGTVKAEIGAGPQGGASAKRVAKAIEVLPASWIKSGNTIPVATLKPGQRGGYWEPQKGRPGFIRENVNLNPGTQLHEYCHHLQRTAPGLNQLFVQLHRRRTKGEPLEVLYTKAPSELGRPDDYVQRYSGREYPASGPAEVFTTAMQQVLYNVHGKEYLPKLLKRDPEMLDLALGALFRYDP